LTTYLNNMAAAGVSDTPRSINELIALRIKECPDREILAVPDGTLKVSEPLKSLNI